MAFSLLLIITNHQRIIIEEWKNKTMNGSNHDFMNTYYYFKILITQAVSRICKTIYLQYLISCSWFKLSKRCFSALFSMLRIRFCWFMNSSSAETSEPSACNYKQTSFCQELNDMQSKMQSSILSEQDDHLPVRLGHFFQVQLCIGASGPLIVERIACIR